MTFLGIIPARYSSTRLPGKPLLMIGTKPMIQHVYERAKEAIEEVIVATDHPEIYDCVISFGGKAVMTAPEHPSGTDRCAEAVREYTKSVQKTFDIIINIQGDEPFIERSQLESLMNCFSTPATDIATLIKPFNKDKETFADLENPNTPKVIIQNSGKAIAFSRSIIPYLRGVDSLNWIHEHEYYKHIGIYAYRSKILEELTKLSPSKLELAESLEQMRWIEHNYTIQTAITEVQSMGIDTLEDLEIARSYLCKKKE